MILILGIILYKYDTDTCLQGCICSKANIHMTVMQVNILVRDFDFHQFFSRVVDCKLFFLDKPPEQTL